jgi:hypothetical protein
MRSLRGFREQNSRGALAFATTSVLMAIAGCGTSDLAQVTGKVTLDSMPLANAFVEFVPTGGQGSTSSGRTNEQGEYALMFSRDTRGASLGPHLVRITTRDVYVDEQGHEAWLPERVPRRYHEASELSVDVSPGRNRFDFDLQSDNAG